MAINFSIPNVPSLTKTTPDSSQTIFVPDIKYLLQFSKGDLGIADNIRTTTILNTVGTAKSPTTATTYLKSAGGIVDDPSKYQKNGKISIPASALTLDPSKNQAGLKALEKSVIQSIFDSQKPYMDMFSQLSNILITIEDVIARALCLPVKSLKPATNPRALGYKKNNIVATKDSLAQLDSLNKNTSLNTQNTTQTSNNDSLNQQYEVESIVYSTGTYNPNVQYTYEYIDINETEPTISGTTSSDEDNGNLPQNLIIAIFDNDGNIISEDDIRNNKYNLSWILASNKWFGNFDLLNDSNDNISLFNQYYTEYTKENLPDTLSDSDKQNVLNQVSNLNSANNFQSIKDQISNLKSNCYFSSVIYNNPSLLSATSSSNVSQNEPINKVPFTPKKLTINGTDMWIDPESDYDLKLIRCDVAYKSDDNDINTNNPFSTDIYGLDDNNSQNIGQIVRNLNSDTSNDEIFDVTGTNIVSYKTYFILEGIVSTNNNQSPDTINNSNGNTSFSYYRKKDFFSAPKQFIKLIIQIATKLTPAINAILQIASSPNKFVTDIMTANLGDNYGAKDVKFIFFSTEFTKKFASLKGSGDKLSIIKNSVLRNYVNLNKDGTYKFLLSGSGFSFLKNIKIGQSVNPDLSTATFSNIYPVTPVPNNLSDNIDYNKLNSSTTTQSETIDYIGGYNPNITYQYIYVNQTVLNILSDGQTLEDSGDLNGALSKYGEALKLDPSNKLISDKIDAVQKLINSFGGNALFSFILGMITMPLEIVLGIIDEIQKIIKGFSSPTTLQDSIKDLVAFKIFPGGLSPLDFFNPTNVLKLAKISFNIELFTEWVSKILIAPLDSYDLNKIIQVPFVIKFPTYNKEQFKSLILGTGKTNMLPTKMLTGILKIFEGIINAIISFFWALMGIGGLLQKPVLKFTKDSNTDISPDDIQALLNGTYTDVIDPNSTSAPNYDFIYNIQLPDGRTLRQLDNVELQNFIEQNSNFQYQYNF